MKKQLLFWIFMLITSVGNAQTMKGYEYWLDNDYNSRITVDDSQQVVSLDIDISNVNSGLHYLNFRAQDNSGKWGGLSRYIIYLSKNTTQYEYWFDNEYDNRIVVNEAPSPMLCADISNFSPGWHYFNFRSGDGGYRWGALSRYIVYVNNNLNRLSCVKYWIDDDVDNIQTVKADNNTIQICVDINELTRGEHIINLQGITQNGRCVLNETLEFVATDWDDAVKAPSADTPLNTVTINYDLHGRRIDKLQSYQIYINGKKKILPRYKR